MYVGKGCEASFTQTWVQEMGKQEESDGKGVEQAGETVMVQERDTMLCVAMGQGNIF